MVKKNLLLRMSIFSIGDALVSYSCITNCQTLAAWFKIIHLLSHSFCGSVSGSGPGHGLEESPSQGLKRWIAGCQPVCVFILCLTRVLSKSLKCWEDLFPSGYRTEGSDLLMHFSCWSLLSVSKDHPQLLEVICSS